MSIHCHHWTLRNKNSKKRKNKTVYYSFEVFHSNKETLTSNIVFLAVKRALSVSRVAFIASWKRRHSWKAEKPIYFWYHKANLISLSLYRMNNNVAMKIDNDIVSFYVFLASNVWHIDLYIYNHKRLKTSIP